MRISFLIAAHNEVATVRDVLDRIRAPGIDAQIVAVDDGSTDGTAEAIERWREEHGDVVLLRQPHRGAFRIDVLRSLRLRQDDFAIEPELTGEVCRRGLRIYQLPIAYYGRTYAEGKKITGETASRPFSSSSRCGYEGSERAFRHVREARL